MSGPILRLPGEGGRPVAPNIVRVGFVLVLAFVVLAAGAGYWQVARARDLSTSPDNPAVIAAHRNVVRGLFYDRDGIALARNAKDKNGEPYRVYTDNVLAPLLGYSSRYYGEGGLESVLDSQLSGTSSGDPALDALRKFESNPYDPSDVTLSVSLALQRQAVAALGGDIGSVVMLDPSTGQILAMASTPLYNANAIASPTQSTASAAWAAVQAPSAHQPLLDRGVQGLYTPGSVFKIVTALGAIGSGTITPDTTYHEQPAEEKTGFVVQGYKVTDGHHPWTDGTALNFYQATEESCNIYYAKTGLALGGDRLKQWADSMGFDSAIPFAGSGPTTAASTLNNGKGSAPGGFADEVELANASYGQAAVSVTPLQMALVASTVANGGLLMKPQLVLSTKNRAGVHTVSPEQLRDVIAPDQAAEVAQAMEQAVEGQYGRLFTVGAAVDGIPTAGKSGTAQLGGTGEPHSWFIGFAPVNNPKVAIAVIVEHGGSGAIKASPIAGKLMTYYLKNVLHVTADGAGSGVASAADRVNAHSAEAVSQPAVNGGRSYISGLVTATGGAELFADRRTTSPVLLAARRRLREPA